MRLVLLTISSSFALVACGADDGSMGDDDETVNCATETRDDTFVVGIEKVGEQGKLNFKILSADPAPPARNDNAWVVQINAMTSGVIGAPVTDATMSVTPFMPDHQHGAGKTVIITNLPDAGQYNLSPINLWMPGLWETTINATSASGNDQVTFRFCIPS
jgi:hypothetical protein